MAGTFLLAQAPPAAGQQLLNPSVDLTYLGSFKLPEDGDPSAQSGKTFAAAIPSFQGPGGVGYNPLGNNGSGSLFLAGASIYAPEPQSAYDPSPVPYTYVAEVSIPTLVKIPYASGANAVWLNAATKLQNFNDLTGGFALNTAISPSPTSISVGNMWFGTSGTVSGKCFWTIYGGYDNGPNHWSHGYSNTPNTLSSPGAHGAYTITDSGSATAIGPRGVAGYVADIPNDANGNWQSFFKDANGVACTHFCGLAGPSIYVNQGQGPGMTCFRAADLIGRVSGYAATARSYICYNNNISGGLPFSLWDSVSFSSQLAGGIFISSPTRYGILFIGQQAKNKSFYGDASYAAWHSDTFPSQTDSPPLRSGQSNYATFGSGTGWPLNDQGDLTNPGDGLAPTPWHRYWYQQVSAAGIQPENTGINGKGVHIDAALPVFWVYDPNVVSTQITGGAPTWASGLGPASINGSKQISYGQSGDPNVWLANDNVNSGGDGFVFAPMGVGYDRANQKIYLVQARRYSPDGNNYYPIVHVYQHT